MGRSTATFKPRGQNEYNSTVKINLHSLNISLNPPKPTKTTELIVADTLATGTFLEEESETDYIHSALPITDVIPTTTGIHVLLPNKATMKYIHTFLVDVSALPLVVRKAQ